MGQQVGQLRRRQIYVRLHAVLGKDNEVIAVYGKPSSPRVSLHGVVGITLGAPEHFNP